MEQLSAKSALVVELERELQTAANDSAKVPYPSFHPYSLIESDWKSHFSISFVHFPHMFSLLQAAAQADQLQLEMDLWPHLTNIILFWHSLCFGSHALSLEAVWTCWICCCFMSEWCQVSCIDSPKCIGKSFNQWLASGVKIQSILSQWHCRSTEHSYLYLLPLCACCKEQKLEQMTTKNQTLQDLENPCIHV